MSPKYSASERPSQRGIAGDKCLQNGNKFCMSVLLRLASSHKNFNELKVDESRRGFQSYGSECSYPIKFSVQERLSTVS